VIVRARFGDREVRDSLFDGSDQIPFPGQTGSLANSWSYSGRYVNGPATMGLPAAMAAIRLLAETIGALPMIVYRGKADVRERAIDVPQWRLLHEAPNANQTAFTVWAYVIAALQAGGNGYLLKTKAAREVQELYPLNPSWVSPRRRDGELVFDYRDPNKGVGLAGPVKTLTTADVIHIPGLLINDPLIGESPVTVHRQALGTALAQEEYQGRFFANDATPRGILKHPGTPTPDQRRDLREAWEAGHRGSPNSSRTAITWGGMEYEQVSLSLQDAQFIDAQKFSIEQIARIFRVPVRSIGGPDPETRSTPEQRGIEFLTYSLVPWIVRVEQALHADDDLFPDKELYPEFLPDALLRADTVSRYTAYVQARQAGWLSVNDIRRLENLPPIDGGDVYQETPVGGAPNLQPQPGDQQPADPGANALRALELLAGLNQPKED
jgi:HK97 family phage portal protein